MSIKNRHDQTRPSRAFLRRQLRPLAENYARDSASASQVLLPILMLIAEQYGEPRRWNEEEDTAEWSIVTRLAPLAARLSRDRRPVEAFKLVASEDLADIHARARRLSELIRDDRYLTADELADRLDAFQVHLTDNREALVRTGFPQAQFVGWPAPLLAHHYYVKLPDNIFDEDDPPRGGQPPRQWIWVRSPSEAEEGERRTRDRSTVSVGFDSTSIVCSYEEAPIVDGLSQANADRLVAGRPVLLDLKLHVLQHLVHSLQAGDATRLWPGCWRLITDAMSSDDIAFYLEVDRSAGMKISADRSEFGFFFFYPGGLTELLLIIGHCEQELTIGAFDRTKRALAPHLPALPDLSYLSYEPYVGALETLNRHGLDLGLDLYERLEREEPEFWASFRTRFEIVLTQLLCNSLASSGIGTTRATTNDPNAGSRTGGVFRRQGDGWTIEFEGQRIQLKDSKGLRYLAHLLRHPGQEFHVLDLVRLADDTGGTLGHASPRGKTGVGEFAGGYSAGFGNGGELADEHTRRELKQRLLDIEEELEDARVMGDTGGADAFQDERERIMNYLKQAYGLGGRNRIAADAGERARISIAQAIRRARTEIKKHHPALAAHLNHIKTGLVCSYDIPAHSAPAWEI